MIAIETERFCCITSLSHYIIHNDLYIVITEQHGNDRLSFLITRLPLFFFLISENIEIGVFVYSFLLLVNCYRK